MEIRTQHTEKNPQGEVSLREVILKFQAAWRYLLSKKWVIGACCLVGAMLGITYASFKKPVYTATTTFVLEEGSSSGSLGNLGGLASLAGIDLGGSNSGLFTGDNILELYKSRAMIQQALYSRAADTKKLLVEEFIEFNNLKEQWPDVDWSKVKFKPGQSNQVQDSVMREVVKVINEKYLSVTKPNTKLSIIQVDVKSAEPHFAKNFNNEIVNAVNKFYIETKTKRSLTNIRILQHKTDSVLAVMNGAINRAAAVVDATPNINITRQAQRTAPVQRSQFTAETNRAILSELVKNLEMSKMALMREAPLIQVVDVPVYPLERHKLGRLKAGLAGILLFGFLSTAYLLIRHFLKQLMNVPGDAS